MNTEGQPRVLVVFASYGTRNLPFLKQLIRVYHDMDMPVDLVVVSEAPKDLGPGVEVIVGLPSKNPWSLPFAHKAVFAQNVDRYDLFVYSEDDVAVTQAHLEAFVRVTEALEPDEIAGYLRYELNGSEKVLTDVHSAFHWKPDSVKRRGAHVVAEFTNEHAGFYVLTQSQLRRAIASGGFLKAPYEGRYGLPETAATDPYTACGFRKVICISALDDFLLHHMSNLYVARHGVVLDDFREQVDALLRSGDAPHAARTLCPTESGMLHGAWSKSYYEPAHETILGMVPQKLETLLSIGCGWGPAEIEIRKRGARVAALPLDSVVGTTIARRGIEVVPGTLTEGMSRLGDRQFDCVLITHLLHLLAEPWAWLRPCAAHVRDGGMLVIAGYNFEYLPDLVRRVVGVGDYWKLKDFDQGRITVFGIGALRRELTRAGFVAVGVKWFDDVPPRRKILRQLGPGRYTSRHWVLGMERARSGSRPVLPQSGWGGE